MAFETGTAANHEDFYDKLISFLTENEDLVAEEQNWEIVWTGNENDGEVVLKGPGLSGQDEVYVGIGRRWELTDDRCRLYIRGLQGVIPSAQALSYHVNPSQAVRVFLDANPMTYWFVANGRRFAAVAKISTIFQALYAGLFIPYGTPTSYPYPLFIGGSAGDAGSSPVNTWRSTSNYHSHFIEPSRDMSSNPDADSSAFLLDPLGQWLTGYNLNGSSINTSYTEGLFFVGPRYFGTGLNAQPGTGDNSNLSYRHINQRLAPAFGGQYVLTPMTLTASHPENQTFGILEGVYDVPGYGNSSENVVKIEYDEERVVDHLVVQNVFRTSFGQYWTLALE